MNPYPRAPRPRPRTHSRNSRNRQRQRLREQRVQNPYPYPSGNPYFIDLSSPSLPQSLQGDRIHFFTAAFSNAFSESLPISNEQNQEDSGRQDNNVLGLENERAFRGYWKKHIRKFYILEYFLLFVFSVLLITTQICDGALGTVLLPFQTFFVLYLLMAAGYYFVADTFTEKAKYSYHILEALFYLIYLFTMEDTTLVGGSIDSYDGVAFLILLNHAIKTLYYYVKRKDSEWKFVKHLNKVETIIRGLFLIQVALILLKCDGKVDNSWFGISWPLMLIVLTLILHGAFLLKTAFSPVGKIFFNPLSKDHLIGLVWVFGVPASFIIGIVGFLVNMLIFLQNPQTDIHKNRPFLPLLSGLVAMGLISIIYTHYFQDQILLIGQFFAGLMNVNPSNQERIMEFVKKLQEEQKRIEEDKATPEFLMKISNAYFKIPTAAQVKQMKKSEKKTKKVKPTEKDKEKLVKGPIEVNAKVEDLEMGPKIIHETPSTNDIEAGEGGKCVICFDTDSDAVYLPCGHGGICYTCAQELLQVKKECHFCRSEVRRLVKINPEDLTKERVQVLSIIKA